MVPAVVRALFAPPCLLAYGKHSDDRPCLRPYLNGISRAEYHTRTATQQLTSLCMFGHTSSVRCSKNRCQYRDNQRLVTNHCIRLTGTCYGSSKPGNLFHCPRPFNLAGAICGWILGSRPPTDLIQHSHIPILSSALSLAK